MGKLTGLSGEYVTFDQNGRKMQFRVFSSELSEWAVLKD